MTVFMFVSLPAFDCFELKVTLFKFKGLLVHCVIRIEFRDVIPQCDASALLMSHKVKNARDRFSCFQTKIKILSI